MSPEPRCTRGPGSVSGLGPRSLAIVGPYCCPHWVLISRDFLIRGGITASMSQNRVAQIFASQLKVPLASISDETSPANTPAWDSLKSINLVLTLEEEFGVRLTTREIRSMNSVAAVKQVLRSKGVADI